MVSKARARRLWLHAQRLDERAPFGDGPQATPAAVRHLGYVQIDTINVVERCHHQILYTRIPGYRRAHLHQAQALDKTVFEYWTHALSYVPSEDFRYFVADMRREARSGNAWFGSVASADVRKVLRRLRSQGPLTIRDIDDDVLTEKSHEWGSRKPSKRALQHLFYRGIVTVSQRSGMLKTYDLASRHFGWTATPKAALERERRDYVLDRALRSQALVSLDSVCHLDAGSKALMRRLIDSRVRRGELVPLTLDGTPHWMKPDLPDPAPDNLVHILSPFDPLVIQRKRLALFFGYAHAFEAYLPKKKRRYGYFTHPVLAGDEIVAVLDLKTDRERGRLLLQQWNWIAKGSRREHKRRIEDALHRFERFQLARD